MKKVKKAYLIGTWFFGIVCGFGHLSFELFAPKSAEIVNPMSQMIVALPGREMDMLSINFGISVIVGVLLLAFGFLNLIIVKNIDSEILLKKLIYTNIVVIIMCILLIVKYLFVGPVVFMGLALISFLRAAFLVKNI